MKKLKIFPKMFIQIFSILGILIILVHSLFFFIFPKTYLETRKVKIHIMADEISKNMNGKELKYLDQTLELYSKSSDIKVFIKKNNNKNELQINDNINVNVKSDSNSLIIEEREIKLHDGKKIHLQFVSTADMQKDAKDLSLKFLPYSLSISFLFSIVISLIYAKSIKNNIQEITMVTDKMIKLDKETRLKISSNDEIGQLKQQINDLYCALLNTINDLEFKNKEILKLEKLKYDFFKGASHELKTPLSSLKILLENMKYNIGKYKDRDFYISECINIVDNLTKNVSQILSFYSIKDLNNDEEYLNVGDTLDEVLEKYSILVNQKKININKELLDYNIYIGKTALNIVFSNLISNAVKYTNRNGIINIKIANDWLLIENSYDKNKISKIN
ncbi:TPA: HAMP domain-containing histidine kinase, partial [Streptococcus agalactiae]|nr:HAMP domain-containing histidine kinase [Streptococcus agalactiae]